MRMRLAVLISVLAVVVASCTDQPSPTTPARHLLADISDGAHSGGNPDFFFLPPLVANPVGNPNFKPGTFNPHLQPVVRVFLLPTDGAVGCSLAGAPVYGPVVATLDAGGEQYQVNWDTKASDLADGAYYRICVFSSPTGRELGFLDVAPVAGGMKKLATNDTYTFQDGRTLPIKVRIQQGALCANPQDCTEFTVTTAGGDFTLPSGFAGLSVPAGAVRPGDIVTVVIEKETPQFTGECLPTDIVQSKGCYHFSSEPALYQFAILVRMEACVDAQYLDEAQRAALRLFKFNTTQGLVQLPQATPTLIDCTNFIALANPAASPPTSFAAAALRGLGRWAGRLLSPPPLYASMPGGVPTGLGGMGDSFSDVGGAVPSSATQAPVLLTVPADATVGQTGLSATASGGSGTGAYSYASSTLPVCTVNATTGSITPLTAGTCSLTATKAADSIYKAATSAPDSFPVAAEAQTIGFAQPTSPAVYGSTFAVAPTASSGLVVTVAATGGCTIASGTVTMTSGTTACVLTASQAGNASYAPAPDVVRTVTASKATQATVTLTVPEGGTVGQLGLVAVAGGGSGTGAISYASSTLPVCTVNAGTGSITLVTAGTCSLTATRAADANYLAATSAVHSFTVQAGGVAITNVDLSPTTLTINGASSDYVATLVNNTGSTLSSIALQGWIYQGDAYRAGGGALVGLGAPTMSTCTGAIGSLPPGSCTQNWHVAAEDTPGIVGSGTFVPGPATARIQLIQGSTVLATFTIPVTLVAPSCPAANDGVLCEPEWATATTFSFNVNLVGGGTTQATAYAWNDADNLHLALKLPYTGTESSLAFSFDNNNVGYSQSGDDVLLLNPPNEFWDEFLPGPCPGPNCYGQEDVAHGGSSNGAGAFHSDGSFSVYEMSHPLNSGDVGHDFSLAPGQTVGMFIFLRLANWSAGQYADTYYPQCQYCGLGLQITIK